MFSPLLAKSYKGQDPVGWWMSEKLDGVRALWDGQNLVTRAHKVIPAPAWWLKDLPGFALDGELWLGRGRFQETVSVVRCASEDKGWDRMHYQVFDSPGPEPVETRWKERGWCLVPQVKCETRLHLVDYMDQILSIGGEGIMLRQPGSLYEEKRSNTLLKHKLFSDAETTVIGHVPHLHPELGMGAVQCSDGFFVGSGFTLEQRLSPPPIGSRITYRYCGLTDAGIPRFPTFVAIRDYES